MLELYRIYTKTSSRVPAGVEASLRVLETEASLRVLEVEASLRVLTLKHF